MNTENQNLDESQRRSLQEYIFSLEEAKDKAEELAILILAIKGNIIISEKEDMVLADPT